MQDRHIVPKRITHVFKRHVCACFDLKICSHFCTFYSLVVSPLVLLCSLFCAFLFEHFHGLFFTVPN